MSQDVSDLSVLMRSRYKVVLTWTQPLRRADARSPPCFFTRRMLTTISLNVRTVGTLAYLSACALTAWMRSEPEFMLVTTSFCHYLMCAAASPPALGKSLLMN